jgi:lipoyl(octanoyl) transferase
MQREKANSTNQPAMETHLLGQLPFDTCLALQQRLVYETSGRTDGQITLLVCEHPPAISIGRLGSRGHVRLSEAELRSRQVTVRWVNRGGCCLPHAPGQLAIYPIVPLEWHRFTVGQYLERLRAALVATLGDLHIVGRTRPGCYDVWGRSGLLAAVGVAVKGWVSYFGAYLNVDPDLRLVRAITSDPATMAPMSSLVPERERAVKMATVRSALIGRLAAALDCPRCHLYTGHPLLATLPRPSDAHAASFA